MVWLYGGSYVAGSASDPRCDGNSFAQKGVVLVTREMLSRLRE